jgi:pimeloyl-ACP methyl ester carboxylesterase
MSAGTCWTFSPASAGASPVGQNANRVNYALEPAGSARRSLVVLLNGSGSFPAQLTIDPSRNLFVSALESGNHVLAVAYRSDVAIANMCDASRPDCYGASRNTLLTGIFTPGADGSLANIREDEGIIPRIDQALRTLVANRPQAGWDAFISSATAAAPADRIAWPRIIAAGHSQGGGHAAYLAKRFPLIRVVQFSSTCDAPAGVPAPWTAANSVWTTSPATAFFGLSAPTVFTNGVPTAGDLNCPYHLAVWQNLGMPLSNQADDATTCAGIDPHGASIYCSANYSRWVALFR